MLLISLFFFFFNDTATTEIYTLSLHDALPIYDKGQPAMDRQKAIDAVTWYSELFTKHHAVPPRSEEHTSELQSQSNLVCRLLLEKKKNKNKIMIDMYSKLHATDMTVQARCCKK